MPYPRRCIIAGTRSAGLRTLLAAVLVLASAVVLAPSHVNPHSTGAAVTITQGADLHLASSGWTAPDVTRADTVEAPDLAQRETVDDVCDQPFEATAAASGCRGPPV